MNEYTITHSCSLFDKYAIECQSFAKNNLPNGKYIINSPKATFVRPLDQLLPTNIMSYWGRVSFNPRNSISTISPFAFVTQSHYLNEIFRKNSKRQQESEIYNFFVGKNLNDTSESGDRDTPKSDPPRRPPPAPMEVEDAFSTVNNLTSDEAVAEVKAAIQANKLTTAVEIQLFLNLLLYKPLHAIESFKLIEQHMASLNIDPKDLPEPDNFKLLYSAFYYNLNTNKMANNHTSIFIQDLLETFPKASGIATSGGGSQLSNIASVFLSTFTQYTENDIYSSVYRLLSEKRYAPRISNYSNALVCAHALFKLNLPLRALFSLQHNKEIVDTIATLKNTYADFYRVYQPLEYPSIDRAFQLIETQAQYKQTLVEFKSILTDLNESSFRQLYSKYLTDRGVKELSVYGDDINTIKNVATAMVKQEPYNLFKKDLLKAWLGDSV
ncbi:hypothetical protein CCFV1_ORF069 [Cotesia congregata filamentous virus 1]|uniref:Uncharacterized protein n=1 Tax=Cotesia congregata filamentous virus 1 TaxID=3064291 RepID=A0ABC8QK89_9VIRU|nr:hypothetical protein CCFV1_ORF069 [Cotesia congregata filamentous virus 1]